MPQRRLLVIGSQCDILNKLDFLPEVAERLHALLRHPSPGGCEGVPLEGCPPGLLLDPTVEAAKKAIKTAIKEAAEAGATLILAYIGHGEFPDEMSGDFYLMPKDAAVPTADEAIDFTVHIKDCIKLLRNRGSLIVLLDTCHAGAGAWQAMKTWAQSLRGNIDFELLTATDDRATADAPLTRAVIELLERGDPKAPERIRCQDVHRLLKHRNRPSQHVAFNPDDARLSLGRNIAHDPGDVFWKDSPGRVEILRHTWYFQPTPQLAELVEASRSHPVVVLTGEAGAGKTSLAGALARPEITGGRVPDDFVHAIAILTRDTNQRSLADDLERQLRRSVPGFAGAVAEFERSVPLPQREALDFLPRKVLQPLAYLVGQPEVRIVLDGFDQLSDFTREAVGGALASRPGHLRLVITARPHTSACPPGYALDHGTTPRDDLDRYLASRRVPDAARPTILDRASGHWLVATLLAQALLNDPAIDLAQLPGTVNEAYTKLLDQAGAADAWKQKFRPVLGPLAVAGAGSVLPLSLLAHASKALGGPEGVEDVRDVLARLRGLVVRRDAGETREHVGLFHTTLAEYLLGSSAAEVGYRIDDGAVHQAMVQAIEALAPMAEHKRHDPLHRYAFLHEADHLWALGEMERLLECLRSRDAYSPRGNLERWRQWFPRFRERFDEDDPTILDLLGRIAFWTGEAGDARAALRLYRELLPDQERV
ncbi:MAG TPA: AAA family ATPase, partial [Acidimicrobiales bacterium]|nr:AAA family ATPase [Acidimicrobiales bacterium]